jgi:hypothetical protein
MKLAFFLTMPGVNSWNGRWSGEGRRYVLIRGRGATKAFKAHTSAILERGYFSYNFGDGWVAGVEVREVTASEAAKLRRSSDGFCGYDWMVDSIMQDGEIYGPMREKPAVEATQ